MSKRGARDWRNKAEQVGGPLWTNEWFRSPLWDQDHLLGADPVWKEDEIAWCGRALGAAREWTNEDYGGLWITNRTAAKCAYCKRKQKEWEARGK